jgi:hypothetical protein
MIRKVELNSDHLQAGGPIAIRVTTTPDVIQVVTGNGPQSGVLTKTGPGIFASESTLPRVGGLATVRTHLYSFRRDHGERSIDLRRRSRPLSLNVDVQGR